MIIAEDTFLGTVNAAGVNNDLYTLNYVHGPATTNVVKYYLTYQLESGVPPPSNTVGIIQSKGNNIVLQELLGSGTANQGSTGYTGYTGYTGPTGTAGQDGVIVQYTTSDFSNVSSSYATDLSENDLSANYFCSITPRDVSSNILVQFRIKYASSYNADDRLTMRVYRYKTDPSLVIIAEDTFLGSKTGVDTNQDLYTLNYIDSPASINPVKYYLAYQVEASGGIPPSNTIGIVQSKGNNAILQELLGSGQAGQGYTGATGPTGHTGQTGAPGVIVQYTYTDLSNVSGSYATNTTEVDLSGSYYCDIQPQHNQSKVLVQFRIKYATSYSANDRLTINVKRYIASDASSSLIASDTYLGTAIASVVNNDIYTLNYVDLPNTTQSVKYYLTYQLEASGGSPPGTIGIVQSQGNNIVLQELLGTGAANQGYTGATGPTGPSAIWTSYIPNLTNLTLGDGTLTARYAKQGQLTTVYAAIDFSGNSSIDAPGVLLSLPSDASANFAAITPNIGTGLNSVVSFRDDSASSTIYGNVTYYSNTAVEICPVYTSGNYQIFQQLTSLIPFTWANGDKIWLWFSYHSNSS